jgi:hypothetical protein
VSLRGGGWSPLDEPAPLAPLLPTPPSAAAQAPSVAQTPAASAPRAPVQPSRRPDGLIVALLVMLALGLGVYGLGHFPTGHPLVPALTLGLPGFGPEVVQLARSEVKFGSTYIVRGTTPHDENGTVVARGSWNGRPSQLLATTTSAAGRYRVRFRIRAHGTLELSITYPGGEAEGVVVVRPPQSSSRGHVSHTAPIR